MSAMDAKPPPRDLSHHLSRVTQARKPSNIKDFYKYMYIPGIGNLAGGMPNNNYFPFDTLEGAAALPDRWQPSPNKADSSSSSQVSLKTHAAQVVVPKESEQHDRQREIDLKTALQYGTAEGYPPLLGFVRQFTRENLHPNVPYRDGPDVVLTCGATDGMCKTIEAFTNPWSEGRDPVEEREGLLCEEFIYTLAIQTVEPRGLNIVSVGIDEEGMRANGSGGLEDVLENWDPKRGRRPHLMYTVTIGQNPTSALMGVERRKELYALCARYDVIIIEDDPYWYLQYPSAASKEAKARGTMDTNGSDSPMQNYNRPRSSGYQFLDSLVPSYLSVDTDGRVIRLDTFSKTVAPGCRLGWITAQPAIIEKILMVTETSTQQPSGYVQSMIAQLIIGSEGVTPPFNPGSITSGSRAVWKTQDGWKTSGWVRWLEGLRGEYERRMNAMCQVLDEGRYLVKTGRRPSLEYALASAALETDADKDQDEWRVVTSTPMYDFQWPRGGMFIWIQMNLHTHPLAKKIKPATLSRALWVSLTQKPYLVLLAPGSLFSANEAIAEEKGWKFYRICFAAIGTDDVESISRRFVSGVRAFWRRKDLDGIEELVAQSDHSATRAAVPGFC